MQCIDSLPRNPSSSRTQTPVSEGSTVDRLVDALYDIGRDFFSESQFDPAVRWFERAWETIALLEGERMTADSLEMKCAIGIFLIRSYLGNKEMPKAKVILADLELVSSINLSNVIA